MLLKTDELGIPRFTDRNLMDMIYSGNIEKCHVVLCDPSDDIDQFNTAMEEQGLPTLQMYIPIDVDQKTFDGICQNEWFMPEEYKNINVLEYFGKIDLTKEQRNRTFEELVAYNERGMLDLLRYMIYLVDFMRENNIVWGVGRGSSVASYVLYLIGVHRINSIKYNLDWREFLR
jgi:DNA polymerase III alpha subunit